MDFLSDLKGKAESFAGDTAGSAAPALAKKVIPGVIKDNVLSNSQQAKDFGARMARHAFGDTAGSTVGAPNRSTFEGAFADGVVKDLAKNVRQDGGLNLGVGLGMNMFGSGGDTMGFLRNKFAADLTGAHGTQAANAFSDGGQSPAMKGLTGETVKGVNQIAGKVPEHMGFDKGLLGTGAKSLMQLGMGNIEGFTGSIENIAGMLGDKIPGVSK